MLLTEIFGLGGSERIDNKPHYYSANDIKPGAEFVTSNDQTGGTHYLIKKVVSGTATVAVKGQRGSTDQLMHVDKLVDLLTKNKALPVM